MRIHFASLSETTLDMTFGLTYNILLRSPVDACWYPFQFGVPLANGEQLALWVLIVMLLAELFKILIFSLSSKCIASSKVICEDKELDTGEDGHSKWVHSIVVVVIDWFPLTFFN